MVLANVVALVAVTVVLPASVTVLLKLIALLPAMLTAPLRVSGLPILLPPVNGVVARRVLLLLKVTLPLPKEALSPTATVGPVMMVAWPSLVLALGKKMVP